MQKIPNKIAIYYKQLLRNNLRFSVLSQMVSLESGEIIASNEMEVTQIVHLIC